MRPTVGHQFSDPSTDEPDRRSRRAALRARRGPVSWAAEPTAGPEKIFFPPAHSPALLPGIRQYAGQQVVTGGQARAYADEFIDVHLSEVAGGRTYAQVSAASLAAPTDAKLAAEKATLFQGETLRGLLLGAWGWSVIATIATVAGLVLVFIGAVLLLLPLKNWQRNLRGRATPTPA